MDTQTPKPDSHLLSFADFWHLCVKNRYIIGLCSLTIATIVFVYYLCQPVTYSVEGTFQDKGKSSSMISQSFSELLMMGSLKNESEAVTFMKSNKLLEKVIFELGGQAHLDFYYFDLHLPRMILNNLHLEYAYWKRHKLPSVIDGYAPLEIRSVVYEGEMPLTARLVFLDETTFQIDDKIGTIGEPFETPDFKFILVKKAPVSLKGLRVDVHLLPLSLALDEVRSRYKIETDKTDKNLICIKFLDTDRYRGCQYVNTLMATYQNFLQQEHDRISHMQLHYLEKRNNEMLQNLRRVMEQYASNITDDLSITGFAASQKEIDFLASTMMENTRRLMDIDLEAVRIQNILCGGKCVHYDQYSTRGDPLIINQILNQIRDFERQGDTLVVAMGPVLDINNPKKGAEFQGVDLEASKQLFISYSRDLSDVQSQARQHAYTLEQLKDPNFEVFSLGTLLHDPVSSERIAKASSLLVALKDENNRTQKEQERLREDLNLEKAFLTLHLKQTEQLLHLRENLLIEKINALQNATYALTQQNIAVLKKHLSDYLSQRMDNLKQEKELLQNYQKELNSKLTALKEKLVAELMVDQHIEMTQKMVEELAKLFESKSISSNMELIQSAPVDQATPPISPKFPHLFVKSLLGAILGLLMGLSIVFFQVVRRGVPATIYNLRYAGEKVSGTLQRAIAAFPNTPISDADLDTLRKVIAETAAPCSQAILLIVGKGVDFTPALANVLFEKGEKVLLVSLDFRDKEFTDESSGLLAYLHGHIPHPFISKGNVFDQIEAGGACRFAVELLQKNSFKNLIDKMKTEYNLIFGICTAAVNSAEAQSLMPLFDQTIVCIQDETIEDIEPYLQRRASFVFINPT